MTDPERSKAPPYGVITLGLTEDPEAQLWVRLERRRLMLSAWTLVMLALFGITAYSLWRAGQPERCAPALANFRARADSIEYIGHHNCADVPRP